MEEVWKVIPGYDGAYEVSSLGRVRSFKRKKCKILIQRPATGGYLYVFLCKNNKVTGYRVHRLVASAFIPNPDGLPQVNHKDENIKNNCVNNLEWVTPEYNRSYGTRNQRIANTLKKKIDKFDKNTGEYICSYLGAEDAAKSINGKKGCESGIRDCCRGVLRTSHGFIWRWGT